MPSAIFSIDKAPSWQVFLIEDLIGELVWGALEGQFVYTTRMDKAGVNAWFWLGRNVAQLPGLGLRFQDLRSILIMIIGLAREGFVYLFGLSDKLESSRLELKRLQQQISQLRAQK